MEGLISTFHIDVKIIIAQVINFAIVFVVLYVFALKPLGKLMRERRAEIEKGLDDAKSSEEELLVAKQKADELLKKAQREANDIIASAKSKGDEIILRAEEDAGVKAAAILEQAKKDIEKEKASIEKELTKKTAGLISLGIKKILGEDIDDEKNNSINARVFEIFKNNV